MGLTNSSDLGLRKTQTVYSKNEKPFDLIGCAMNDKACNCALDDCMMDYFNVTWSLYNEKKVGEEPIVCKSKPRVGRSMFVSIL